MNASCLYKIHRRCCRYVISQSICHLVMFFHINHTDMFATRFYHLLYLLLWHLFILHYVLILNNLLNVHLYCWALMCVPPVGGCGVSFVDSCIAVPNTLVAMSLACWLYIFDWLMQIMRTVMGEVPSKGRLLMKYKLPCGVCPSLGKWFRLNALKLEEKG